MSVEFNRITWANRVVQRPNVYTMTDNGDGTVTMTPTPGTVTAAGTKLNASNLNRIEKGVKDCADEINNLDTAAASLSTGLVAVKNRVSATESAIAGNASAIGAHDTRISAMETAWAGRTALITATVPAAGWTADGALVKVTVSASGLLATDTPIADVAQSGDEETDAPARNAFATVTRMACAAGALTVWALEAPEAAFDVRLMCVR